MSTSRSPDRPPDRLPRRSTRRLSRVLVVLVAAVSLWAGERPALATDGWVAPLGRPVQVLRGFDPPALRWLAGHRGVDLAAAPGAEVAAAGAGVVTFAAPLAGRGVVVVRHGSLRTTYEPVTASVAEGTVVATGQVLGAVEPSEVHCAGRTCLHWGLLRGSTYLDPLALLGLAPVRLLPLPPRQGARGTAVDAAPATSAAGPTQGATGPASDLARAAGAGGAGAARPPRPAGVALGAAGAAAASLAAALGVAAAHRRRYRRPPGGGP